MYRAFLYTACPNTCIASPLTSSPIRVAHLLQMTNLHWQFAQTSKNNFYPSIENLCCIMVTVFFPLVLCIYYKSTSNTLKYFSTKSEILIHSKTVPTFYCSPCMWVTPSCYFACSVSSGWKLDIFRPSSTETLDST